MGGWLAGWISWGYNQLILQLKLELGLGPELGNTNFKVKLHVSISSSLNYFELPSKSIFTTLLHNQSPVKLSHPDNNHISENKTTKSAIGLGLCNCWKPPLTMHPPITTWEYTIQYKTFWTIPQPQKCPFGLKKAQNDSNAPILKSTWGDPKMYLDHTSAPKLAQLGKKEPKWNKNLA